MLRYRSLLYFVGAHGISKGFMRAQRYKEYSVFKCSCPSFQFVRYVHLKSKLFGNQTHWKSFVWPLVSVPLICSGCFVLKATMQDDKSETVVSSLLPKGQQKLEDPDDSVSSAKKVPKSRGSTVILSGLFFEISLGLTGSLFAWKLGLPVFGKGFHISPSIFLQGAIACVPLLGFVYVLEQLPFQWLKETASQTQRIIAEVFLPRSSPEIGLLCACTGLAEEVAFRSFLYSWLVSRMHLSATQGLIVSSVVFGLFHPVSPAYVYIASLAGSYFGFLYIVSGNNIVVPAVAHAVYDYVILEISRYQMIQKNSNLSNKDKME
jgi:membrane protease YdiL (CAAX protease family)